MKVQSKPVPLKQEPFYYYLEQSGALFKNSHRNWRWPPGTQEQEGDI